MAGDKDGSLSAREMEVLALAWQCMDAPPKIDMQKLALLTGYTPGSAAVTMGNIKRKLKQRSTDASPSSAPSTPKRASAAAGRSKTGAGTGTVTPKSSTGKRGASASASASASATPSKRAKNGGGQGKKMVAKEEDDADVPMSGGARVKKEVLDEALEYGGGEEGGSGGAMLKGVGRGGDEEDEE